MCHPVRHIMQKVSLPFSVNVVLDQHSGGSEWVQTDVGMCSAQTPKTMEPVFAAPGNLMTCSSWWVFGNTDNRTFVYRHVCFDLVGNERVKKTWKNQTHLL